MVVVDIDDPKPYESHVDISMFIRTRRADGFIFYLGSDPFKNDRNPNIEGDSGVRSAKPQIFKPDNAIDEAPRISNITCELVKGTIQVTISSEKGKRDTFNLYSAKLSNGYRHFVRVIRQNNLMTVTVNGSITINQDFPVAPTFTIEKLYLGNLPVRSNKYWDDNNNETEGDVENEVFGDDSSLDSTQDQPAVELVDQSTTKAILSQNKVDSTTQSTTFSSISSQDTTTTSTNQKISSEPILQTEANLPNLSTFTSETTTVDKRQGSGQVPENEIQTTSVLNNNNNLRNTFRPPRLLEDTEAEGRQFNEERTFATAPLSSNPVPSIELTSTEDSSDETISRARREISEGDENKINKKFFKGIIQDVQITNGDKSKIRIVELFEQTFETSIAPELPKKVGTAKTHHILEGEISDQTCIRNPCEHDGICHVTWNDYRCECVDGWKGRNCSEKEFCFWYDCPGESTCVSLSDGYECLTNATFNGETSSVSYKPQNFPNSSYSSPVENTIKTTFRSKYIKSGTILHIVGDGEYVNKYIRISIRDEVLSLEIPEGNTILNPTIEGDVLSGDWKTVEIVFAAGGGPTIKARLNNDKINGEFEIITLDSDIDFAKFISTSKNIIIGSSTTEISDNQKDVYTTDQVDSTFESVQIHQTTDFFRGCIGEVRIAGILLPFFLPSWLNETKFPRKKKFLAEDLKDLDDTGCKLCYESECKNSGKCMNPSEKFECDCLPGFEDSVCGTNIDECLLGNKCQNSVCVDGIANYTCECNVGWEGWL